MPEGSRRILEMIPRNPESSSAPESDRPNESYPAMVPVNRTSQTVSVFRYSFVGDLLECCRYLPQVLASEHSN